MSGISITAELALLSLSIWIVLLIGRGRFWRCRERDDRDWPPSEPAAWPPVVAVIPARNEADILPQSLPSLLAQDYPGAFSVLLVDDSSDDGTHAVAQALAAAEPGRLEIVQGTALPPGWTGKLWALHLGVTRAAALALPPKYLLLTDADIAYDRDALRSLVLRAEARGHVLVSLMAKLRCHSLAERALVPAFIFFFQMLYPFAWVNRPERKIAAAAGGCMLVLRTALDDAGGIASIRGALIDDCALAARLKLSGAIWLGLTERVRSVRPYPRFGDIRRMVARSAYAQLHYSPWLLSGAVAGMVLTYLTAPLIAVFASGWGRAAAALAWLLIALSFWPVLRFYRLSLGWAPFLPAIAAAYIAFTLDSALQHLLGRGGMWKGRAQALASDRS